MVHSVSSASHSQCGLGGSWSRMLPIRAWTVSCIRPRSRNRSVAAHRRAVFPADPLVDDAEVLGHPRRQVPRAFPTEEAVDLLGLLLKRSPPGVNLAQDAAALGGFPRILGIVKSPAHGGTSWSSGQR